MVKIRILNSMIITLNYKIKSKINNYMHKGHTFIGALYGETGALRLKAFGRVFGLGQTGER